MKKVWVILFFLPLLSHGQQINKDQWGNAMWPVTVWEGWSEYLNTYIRTTDSTWWAGGNDISLRGTAGVGTQAIPNKVSVPAGVKFIQVASSLHDDMAVSSMSDTSFGYEIGSNAYGQRGDGTTSTQNTAYKLRFDSSGTLFDSLRMIAGGFYPTLGGEQTFYTAVKNNGTVWNWGYLAQGGQGNQSAGGTLKKPAQVFLASGKLAQFISSTDHVLVLCTDSTVQSYGNDDCLAADLGRSFTGTGNRSPVDIGLAHIVYVMAGYGINYAIDRNGDIWEWGAYCKLYGGQNFTTGLGSITTPTKVTSTLGLPATVRKLVVNHNATLALLTNGQLWSWGGVPDGSNGIGQDFNWIAYTGLSGTTPYNGATPAPYNWNLEYYNFSGDYVDYVVATPHQVAAGKSNFCQVFGGELYTFNFAANDSTDQFYQWGRGKGAVMANGVLPADTVATQIQASYHVSWDQSYPQLDSPFNITTYAVVTSPYCVLHPSGSPCSNFTIPTRTAPHASVTSFTTSPGRVVLNGTASTAHFFVHKLWTQLTGPATAQMAIQTSPTDSINLTTTGVYTFQYKITDDVWQSDSAVSTITVVNQTDYYVAAAGSGTACTDPGSGGTPCAPSYLATITPLLQPGNVVHLNRGDVFPVEMNLTQSGTSGAGNTIMVTAYGTGADPVIGGMTTLSGWTNTSGHLWSASWSGLAPTLLTENGVLSNKSRTPNSGYSTFIPASGSTTDLHFASNPYSLHDSIAVKSSGFTYDFTVCTASTATDATISPALSYNNVGGNGSFRIGDTPDTANEWNLPSAGTVQAYSVASPTGYAVPTVGIPLTISGNYITVTNVKIMGADTACILLSGSHVNIVNDSIMNGMDGIRTTSATLDSITFCYFAHFGNNAIQKTNSTNYNNVIEHNTVLDQGMIPGMGTPGNTTTNYTGIVAGDSGCVVKYNWIDSAGYNGVSIFGHQFKADSNIIHKTNQLLPDGGGIYTWVGSATSFRQREITGNQIDSIGGPQTLQGTSLSAESEGIYLDNWASDVTVSNNSVSHCQAFNLYDHGPRNSFTNNTTYQGGTGETFFGETGSLVITSSVVKHNNFGAQTGLPIWIFSVNNDLASFGAIDSNAYFSYRQLIGGWKTQSSVDPGTSRGITSWQSNVSYDLHSNWTSGQMQYLLGGSAGLTITLTGLWVDGSGNQYHGTITIPAYQSLLLMRLDLDTVPITHHRINLTP